MYKVLSGILYPINLSYSVLLVGYLNQTFCNSLFTPPTHTRQDKTVVSCLVHVSGVNTTTDKIRQFCLVSTQFSISTFSVIFSIFETEQLQIVNWVETRQNCLVLSAVVFSQPTWTRQNCLVLSAVVFTQPTWTRQNCLVSSVSAVWTRCDELRTERMYISSTQSVYAPEQMYCTCVELYMQCRKVCIIFNFITS